MRIIHPTAIIDPTAKLDLTVKVGAYSIIGPNVSIGADCEIDTHVHIKKNTKIGARNNFLHASLIGEPDTEDIPKDQNAEVVIGEDNTFRDFCRIRAGATGKGQNEGATKIGNHNYFMGGTSVGSSCTIGSHNLIIQNCILGKNVHIQDYTYIAGLAYIHHNCRVGSCVIVSGGSAVKKDIPPFALAHGPIARIIGLNSRGLKRAGITPPVRKTIKQAFHIFFPRKDQANQNESRSFAEKIALVRNEILEELSPDSDTYQRIYYLINFIEQSKQGVMT